MSPSGGGAGGGKKQLSSAGAKSGEFPRGGAARQGWIANPLTLHPSNPSKLLILYFSSTLSKLFPLLYRPTLEAPLQFSLFQNIFYML